MLGEMKSAVEASHGADVAAREVKAADLKAMYANDGDGAAFTGEGVGASTKNLKGKTFTGLSDTYEALFDEIEATSKLGALATDGTAGLMLRGSKSKYILVDSKGHEYGQTVEKGLMGAVFYAQALSESGYLRKVPNDDNTTPEEGKEYTTAQHHLDEGFGYFTNSEKFPEEGKSFWAKYADKRNSGSLKSSDRILKAFVEARYVLSNEGFDAADLTATLAEIDAAWQDLVAGQALYYLNDAKDVTDAGDLCHVLSEAYQFVSALKFNSNSKVDADKVNEILDALGHNFWKVTPTTIGAAATLLQEAMGWDDTFVAGL
jgi:hypothetical protein